MSTFHQRSTCHLHKLQVLKPGLWPWRPSWPLRNDLCIQKCALRLQAVELLKFSPRNTKHVPCSWLTYHPWCQATALWSALLFWSGDTCHAGHAVGKAWSWDASHRVLSLTWPPGMCGRGLVPLSLGLHFLPWHAITWALKHLWLYDFTTQQDNANYFNLF